VFFFCFSGFIYIAIRPREIKQINECRVQFRSWLGPTIIYCVSVMFWFFDAAQAVYKWPHGEGGVSLEAQL
jgi:hypothetical protein